MRGFFSGATCSACREVCPADAVDLKAAPALRPACTGCGGCVGACPTGALDGAPNDDEAIAGGLDANDLGAGVAGFQCERAPVARRGIVVLPCLGRVTETLLLETFRRGARWIDLVSGACDECDSRSAVAPLDASVALARAVARAAAPPVREVSVERAKSALSRPVKPSAVREAERTVFDRRRFLRALGLGREAGKAGVGAGTGVGAEGRAPRRRRFVKLAAAMVPNETAVTLPSGAAFGRITVSGACEGCILCDAVCPTGAVERVVSAERMTLSVADSLCTACGICRDACIDNAIAIEPPCELRPGKRTLREISGRPCAICGAVAAEGSLCRFCVASAKRRLGRRVVLSRRG